MRAFLTSKKLLVVFILIIAVSFVVVSYYDIVYTDNENRYYTHDQIEKIDVSFININTADKETLCTLPSLSERQATEIIKYREENGNFQSIDEVKNVKWIDEKTFRKINMMITV